MFIFLLGSVMVSIQANLFASNVIIKSQSHKDKNSLRIKKKRLKKNKRDRANGFGSRSIKKRMNNFLKTVPPEYHEKAQKIITYLHTSHRVARSYMKSKNTSAALEIFNKRLRLKVPDFFKGAPPVLKYFKLATKAAISKIYLSEKNAKKALDILEISHEEAQKHKDFPKPMMIDLRHQLMRAYRILDMHDKADRMLESALRDAEAELEFE
tara:strand:+ start:48 stop:680 length:633 start_codon:yes stop_codon:yes gene_type:complete